MFGCAACPFPSPHLRLESRLGRRPTAKRREPIGEAACTHSERVADLALLHIQVAAIRLRAGEPRTVVPRPGGPGTVPVPDPEIPDAVLENRGGDVKGSVLEVRVELWVAW